MEATLKSLMLPKRPTEVAGFISLLFMIHWLLFFQVGVVLAEVHSPGSLAYRLVQLISLISYVNSMYCIYKLVTVDVTSGSEILPAILPRGWRFCYSCELNAPPRSHHCFTCDKCVLKRDHHCLFTGGCVGHANHRFYLNLVSYGAAGVAVAGVWLNVPHVVTYFDRDGLKSVPGIIFPFFTWLFGFIDAYSAVLNFTFTASTISTCLLVVLTARHVTLVSNGQTSREFNDANRDYDLGWEDNVAQTFGDNWKLAIFTPFVASVLPSNGIQFTTKEMREQSKSI
ncbi:putative palmitoyltransferase ZDHHC24 [Tubulanus polymorphus]|uniref:putative palmitoyltransferase ZDHHC24 n=1 Tax=Tubulanus polymorphus TaxID=672921 RepID=UPI003DA58552